MKDTTHPADECRTFEFRMPLNRTLIATDPDYVDMVVATFRERLIEEAGTPEQVCQVRRAELKRLRARVSG